MTDDEREKKREDFLKMLEEEEPFNKEKYDAEMKALENTMWEWAEMEPDGSISVKVWEIRERGRRGDGGFVIAVGEVGYEECKTKYKLQKPGDSYGATNKLVNGEWVALQNNDE